MPISKLQESIKNHLSEKLLRAKQAAPYLNISRTTLWRLSENDPDFPRKIFFSKRIVCWKQSDLDAYIELKSGGVK